MVDRDILFNSQRVMVAKGERDPGQIWGHRGKREQPVFSRGKAISRADSLWTGRPTISYRTTERDKAPAREVLTPILMGDPAPGRVMPDQATGERRCGLQVGFLKDGRRHTESGPILLTFKEYNEYYGDKA